MIHGAIGWTAEMELSLYLLRSKELENDCGGSDFHKDRIARELERSEPDFMMMKAYQSSIRLHISRNLIHNKM